MSPATLAPPQPSPPTVQEPPPAQVLAQAVLLDRGEPTQWRQAPRRSSLAGAVIDAVMSPRVTSSTVDAVVRRYDAEFGPGTPEALLASFEALGLDGWRERIGTNHRTHSNVAAPFKSDVIAQAARLLTDEKVSAPEDLWARVDDDGLRAAWCGLPGQSSGGSWRHLILVSGYREVVVCPLTRRYLRRALPRPIADLANPGALIDSAADVLDVDGHAFEHQMWRAALTARERRRPQGDDGVPDGDERS